MELFGGRIEGQIPFNLITDAVEFRSNILFIFVLCPSACLSNGKNEERVWVKTTGSITMAQHLLRIKYISYHNILLS